MIRVVATLCAVCPFDGYADVHIRANGTTSWTCPECFHTHVSSLESLSEGVR